MSSDGLVNGRFQCADGVVALSCHPAVGPILRKSMTLLIIGTIFLFVVAAVTPGVFVAGVASTIDTTWTTPGVASLSICNSLGDMFRSRSYPLCFVIIFFTVAWPYAKLLMMLYAWLWPCGAEKRGKLLIFLDQVGKWSLTDNIVLTFLVVFFYVNWSGSNVVAANGSRSSLEIRCIPGLEFHCYIVSTMASLVLGHTMLAIHRVSQGAFRPQATSMIARPVWKEVRSDARPSVQRLIGLGGTAALLGALALIVMAWLMPLAQLEYGGVIGGFLDITDQPRLVRYSIATIVRTLVNEHDAYLGVVIFIFLGLLPALLVVALLLLWLVPLVDFHRFIVLTACQTLAAWSSLDVAGVALLGAVLGGDEYGIGHYLEMIIYQGTVAPVCDALRDSAGIYCLTIKLDFVETSWVLFAAALANVVASQICLRAIRLSNNHTSTAQVC